MGYKSEVAILLKRELYDNITNKLKEEKDQNTYELVTSIPSHIEFTEKCVLLHYQWIKWYDTFPEMKKLEDILLKANPEDYHFIRIGEEINDIEDWGDYYNENIYLAVRVTIAIEINNNE